LKAKLALRLGKSPEVVFATHHHGLDSHPAKNGAEVCREFFNVCSRGKDHRQKLPFAAAWPTPARKACANFWYNPPPIANAAEDACPLTRSYSRREMQHCKRRDGDQQRTNNLSLVHKPVKRGNSGV
jgi:hypothetical protein